MLGSVVTVFGTGFLMEVCAYKLTGLSFGKINYMTETKFELKFER